MELFRVISFIFFKKKKLRSQMAQKKKTMLSVQRSSVFLCMCTTWLAMYPPLYPAYTQRNLANKKKPEKKLFPFSVYKYVQG